jgi:BMFP domain-containing protein YqiC
MFKSKKRKELENRVANLESALDQMSGVLNTLSEVSAAATTDTRDRFMGLSARIDQLNAELREK